MKDFQGKVQKLERNQTQCHFFTRNLMQTRLQCNQKFRSENSVPERLRLASNREDIKNISCTILTVVMARFN
jgi:hypothetical protein